MGRASGNGVNAMVSNPYPKPKDVQADFTVCELCDRSIKTKDWTAHKNSKKHRAIEQAEKDKENGKTADGEAAIPPRRDQPDRACPYDARRSGPLCRSARCDQGEYHVLDVGRYTCTVSGDCGSVTSSALVLSVSQGAAITTQPQAGVAACAGGTVTASLQATGPNLKYQWYTGELGFSAKAVRLLGI